MADNANTSLATVPAADRIVEFTPLGELASVKLSVSICRAMGLAQPTKSGAMPTDADLFRFIMLCRARALNPFSGDVFFTGYEGRNGPEFAVVAGVQTLFKRAELSPEYDGIESGLIVQDGDEFRDVAGAFIPPKCELIGAWARVYRKDRGRPYEARINRSAFDKQRSQWTSMPGVMLLKCAEAAALRRSFPSTLAEMYLREEFDADITTDSVTTDSPAARPKNVGALLANASAAQPPAPNQQPPATQETSPAIDAPADVMLAFEADLATCDTQQAAYEAAGWYMEKHPQCEAVLSAAYKAICEKRGWK